MIRWDKKSGGIVGLGDGRSLHLDASTEFGGDGLQPCPDELFFSAIGGCLLTTFLYFQRKLRLSLQDLKISVHGEVKFLGLDGYFIDKTYAVIHIKTTYNEVSKAKRCGKLTEDFCHITRVLEKTLPIEISTLIEHT